MQSAFSNVWPPVQPGIRSKVNIWYVMHSFKTIKTQHLIDEKYKNNIKCWFDVIKVRKGQWKTRNILLNNFNTFLGKLQQISTCEAKSTFSSLVKSNSALFPPLLWFVSVARHALHSGTQQSTQTFLISLGFSQCEYKPNHGKTNNNKCKVLSQCKIGRNLRRSSSKKRWF